MCYREARPNQELNLMIPKVRCHTLVVRLTVELYRTEESEMISTRTLALTRYRRNHEFMNEVFMYAAFGTFIHIFIGYTTSECVVCNAR